MRRWVTAVVVAGAAVLVVTATPRAAMAAPIRHAAVVATATPLPTPTPGTTFIIGPSAAPADTTPVGPEPTHNNFTGLAAILMLVFGILAAASVFVLRKTR